MDGEFAWLCSHFNHDLGLIRDNVGSVLSDRDPLMGTTIAGGSNSGLPGLGPRLFVRIKFPVLRQPKAIAVEFVINEPLFDFCAIA